MHSYEESHAMIEYVDSNVILKSTIDKITNVPPYSSSYEKYNL